MWGIQGGPLTEKRQRNEQILTRLIKGERIRALAAEFGISPSRIGQIGSRELRRRAGRAIIKKSIVPVSNE